MSKNQRTKSSIIAGLDIGTTRVVVAVAIVNSEGKLEITGVGTAPNMGMKMGSVVNIDMTTEAIQKAREEAELMSGQVIDSVWLGISGTHIKSFDSKGMVAIKNKEVTAEDVHRVIDAAKAVAVPTDRKVLHVLPREYKVDSQEGILDPIGMSGVRLESNVHIVTGGVTAIQNSIKCTEKADLKVNGLVMTSLASAKAVLSADEKNLGVAVADMGGGTTDIVYYINGSVTNVSCIPLGGQHFTHDVAVGLRTPQASAEEIKKKHGCAMATLVNSEDTIEVEGVGGRKARAVLRKDLAEVLEPRAEEALHMMQNDLQNSGLVHLLGSGVVFTGGASHLDGFIEMGEFVFDVPIRRGLPGAQVGGLTEIIKSASYSTAVGLLLHGYEVQKLSQLQETEDRGFSNVTKKIKNLIEDLF